MTQKIVRAASRIAASSGETRSLGNLDIHRDWGWAPEYVEVMWLMLQQERLDDFVIATRRSVSQEYFVSRAFKHFGLSWRDHTQIDSTLLRPSDIRFGAADPSRAHQVLGWKARPNVDDVIAGMCQTAAGEIQQTQRLAHRCDDVIHGAKN